MGYRLPLDMLPWVDPTDHPYVIETDPTVERPPLADATTMKLAVPGAAPLSKTPHLYRTVKPFESAHWLPRTALCVQVRKVNAPKDAKQGKATYVSAMGIARARQFAEELRGQAQAALLSFGVRAGRLAQLADFIVLRKF